MSQLTGRKREADRIRRANRAAAVGNLMLGKLNSWEKFLEPDIVDLEKLPRRQLKSGVSDINERLLPEIEEFCRRNFHDMDVQKLSLLYEEIKEFRGIESPLKEFEKKYGKIRREVLKGNPNHLTLSISLWGLKFQFPEDEITKDILTALDIVVQSQDQIKNYKGVSHRKLEANINHIASLMRQEKFSSRSIVLSCFNLIEAYLNGLAWDYLEKTDLRKLSNTKQKLLKDTNQTPIRDKLRKYPAVIAGKELWEDNDQLLESFIDTIKPFRDSLVHPSPFSAPLNFGGYDKLRLFYRVDYDTALMSVDIVVKIIKRIHAHVYSSETTLPKWIQDLEFGINQNTSKE